MALWYVASQNPGTSSFLDAGLVAVNFWVRAPADGLDEDGVKAAAAGRHPRWDSRTSGTRTAFARQLVQFASEVAVGDEVVTFDAAARDAVLVGTVVGGYEYEDAATLPDHPHVRAVEWRGTTDRAALPDGGAGIEHVRGTTIRRLPSGPAPAVAELDDRPWPAPAPAPHREAMPTRARDRARDTYSWEPAEGPHRYVLRQRFGGGPAERPLLVVMLNPAANHVPGFRRSTTCHAVRRWGEEHGHDGAVYVNLFSFIEPNSSFLHRVPFRELNGAGADAAIARVADEVAGVALAGWGNLPPRLRRDLYDRRVAEVRRLLGRDLLCLGTTRSGYPRHGRGWRPTDEPVPLP